MPTYSQTATSWTSIPRSGSLIAWAGIATALQTLDANWAEWPITGAAPGPYTAEILRAAFPTFGIPVTDVIDTITVYVRHKQPANPNPIGATCIFENTSADIVSQTAFFTTTITLSPTAYTITALNAPTATYDLLYNVVCGFPLIFPDVTPYVDVDRVTLEVVTHPAAVVVPPVGEFGMEPITRIPSIGFKP